MPKLLLIDDDVPLLTAVADSLKTQHFTVDTACDGTKAQGMLRETTYDLIVVDWGIPGLSGLDLCKWFRGRGGTTPMLMLTGKADIEDKETGFNAGVDDYLTKPFDVKELALRLNALLRRGGVVVPTRVLQLGNLSVDPSTHRAMVEGKDLELTPKEFDILEFFIRHQNQVFSLENLIDRLWKSGAEVSTETVRVFIRRLRDKLEKHGCGALIKNVHGVGYKLSSD